MNISKEEIKLLAKKILYKRGNVVWIDFGFSIGSEFGGMHPAIILKTFWNDLFVLPVTSKKRIVYVKREKDLSFTIQDMLKVYYGKSDYAKYDN